MTIWDQVTKVTDIRLYYNSGEPSATIYGNGRHCVAFNISFNAKKGTEELDISGQDLSQHVQLINFDSSKPLASVSTDSAPNSLFYKREGSNFEAQLMSQTNYIEQDKLRMRGQVTFYVYANAETDFTSYVAVRFLLRSGNTQDTSAGNSLAQKLSMRVLRPIIYSVDDITPFEWVFVREKDVIKVYNAYLRPRDKSRFWKFSQFNRLNIVPIHELHVSMDSDGIYLYQVASLGSYVSAEMNFLEMILPIAYNREAGALTVVKQVIPKQTFHDVLTHNGQIGSSVTWQQTNENPLKVRLYDQFGNVAAFSFTYEDFVNPKLVPVSPDFSISN